MLRFLVLVLLLVVIITSFLGLTNKKPFSKLDNILGLSLFSVTHTQLLVGILLYFNSSFVSFSKETMKNAESRYWTVEHFTMMLIAIVLITMARITAKKMPNDAAKHKRMLVFNSIALVVILATIAMSKRGLFSITGIAGM